MKKAGIIVGATVAGLLAVSPLAFAADESGGIVNGLNDNNVTTPVQGCNNNLNGVGVQGTDLTGALGGTAAGSSDTCSQPASSVDG